MFIKAGVKMDHALVFNKNSFFYQMKMICNILIATSNLLMIEAIKISPSRYLSFLLFLSMIASTLSDLSEHYYGLTGVWFLRDYQFIFAIVNILINVILVLVFVYINNTSWLDLVIHSFIYMLTENIRWSPKTYSILRYISHVSSTYLIIKSLY